MDEFKDALKKILKMLKYPRLVTLLNKQLNFERVEFFVPKKQTSKSKPAES